MTLSAEELARALGNGSAQRQGGEWRTLCPIHEADGAPHNPSLGIAERNGVIVWKCRTGCDKDAVTAAIRDRGLLNGNGGSTRPERRHEPREITKRIRFEIRDLSDAIQGVHVRLEFEGGGKRYEWEGGLKGRPVTSMPLEGSERLPALPDGATVILCEGEPPAAALRRAGLAAVATVTGAATIPDDSALACLLRFRVVLWPDNDNIGRQHMSRIAARLLELGAKEVFVIDWPDAPPSGDAADFEGDDTALLTLIESARPFTPPTVRAFGQLASEVADTRIDWLIKHYFARGTLCELTGNPGDGKTYLAIAIAAGFTRGNFAGMPCAQGSVAFLSAEDSPEDLKRLAKAAEADLARVRILPSAFESEDGLTPITLPEHISLLESALRADSSVMLFIDPITAFLTGKTDSHNDASSRKVLAELSALAQRTHTTICLIRHLNKMGSVDKALYRGGGSIAFTAAARTSFLIGPDPTDQAPEIMRRRVIACIKSNLAPKPPALAFVLRSTSDDEAAHVEFLQEPSQLTADDLLREPRQRRKPEALEEAIQFLHDQLDEGPKNGAEIIKHANALEISETTLKRACLKISVNKIKKGFTGGWVWSLSNNNSEV